MMLTAPTICRYSTDNYEMAKIAVTLDFEKPGSDFDCGGMLGAIGSALGPVSGEASAVLGVLSWICGLASGS